MYEVLALVAEERIRESAKQFEDSIQKNISELLQTASDTFGSNSDIRLPENLRNIFESLEFNSNEIPLSRRGDGIKVRHIPMILNFMDEKRNKLLGPGAIRYTHIWGFEEPENNVELVSAFDMQAYFVSVSKKGTQLFVTTHSPAFYADDESASQDRIKVYGVKKIDMETQLTTVGRADLDHEMGILPLVAPFVKEERKKWRVRVQEAEDALSVANSKLKDKPTIFVEGDTDKRIIEKCIKVYYPKYLEKIEIVGSDAGYGSARAALNRGFAWQLVQETKPKGREVRAVVWLDGDAAGQLAGSEFEDIRKKIGDKKRNITKIVQLKTNEEMGVWVKSGFNLPLDIEFFLSDRLWEFADKRNWLEDCNDISQRIKAKKMNEYIKQNRFDFMDMDDGLHRRILKSWTNNGKEKISKYIATMPDEQAKEDLRWLEDPLTDAVNHLMSKS